MYLMDFCAVLVCELANVTCDCDILKNSILFDNGILSFVCYRITHAGIGQAVGRVMSDACDFVCVSAL